MSISAQQSRFWNELTQLRGHIEYLNLYHSRYEAISRWIHILTAVAASGSIAAWAVWGSFPMVWASIVAAGQVFAVITPYLPFQARMKATGALANKLEPLFVQWEGQWQQVADGDLTESEISETITRLKDAKLKLQIGHLMQLALPINEELQKHAGQLTDDYFMATHGAGGEDG
jgi:hypothetical protein